MPRLILRPTPEFATGPKEINEYGTVHVTMTLRKMGRSVAGVRFDWQWKTLDQARVTDEENEQPVGARHMDRKENSAPPLRHEPKRLQEERQRADKERFRQWREQNPNKPVEAYFAERKLRAAE